MVDKSPSKEEWGVITGRIVIGGRRWVEGVRRFGGHWGRSVHNRGKSESCQGVPPTEEGRLRPFGRGGNRRRGTTFWSRSSFVE